MLKKYSELRDVRGSVVNMDSRENRQHWEVKTVEEENEQGPETATIDHPAAAPLAEKPDAVAIRRALNALASETG